MTIRLRVFWVGVNFLLRSTDHVLNFSEHNKRFHSVFFSDVGIDQPSLLLYYKAYTQVLSKMRVDSFYFGNDVYNSTEDESQLVLIDWYQERMKLKNQQNISNS